ncbi:glycosyl-4,4'-diaponeurosporenoate acyltransferase [Bacillus sp. FJAT-45037]|uniref:glycosyl-4,4'-diaponeurosporenoate acyltransferase CrtO family protein n=1 Tax=Bacillus sp. FJAT-45037 TaxID=2011007 RepID=UPI000C241213|nr:glycosyl-4,4'-diaponeurosporenoate acyltransferase [Bacillus sp. FJAT-45037]
MSPFFVNTLALLVIQLTIVLLSSLFSKRVIEHFNWIFQLQEWEKNGQIYDALSIKAWKTKLPDGGGWTKRGIKKNKLNVRVQEDLQRFILETKRAELSHLLQIAPAPIFFTFNDTLSGTIIVLYALCFNLPFILIQRYNRGRLVAILKRKEPSFLSISLTTSKKSSM